ncbi:MAG: WbqC family protein [Pelolinea sp.]|nr:WbqC family protein [Pelolinea sp.]
MKCVILQPSYIPWRGFFHQIWKADLFIFYDDVQYDKNGWRNRNRIKTSQGLQWLTIPVHTKGSVPEGTPINQIKISWERPWNLHHWRGIQFAYRKAPFFGKYIDYFSEVFGRKPEFLSNFTIQTTIDLARFLGISHTKFIRSSEIDSIEGEKTDRLISILKKVGADYYISGPSAKDYIEKDKFDAAGIKLEYMTYNYPEYEQLYPPFESQVSIIDLLFMKGDDSLTFIR